MLVVGVVAVLAAAIGWWALSRRTPTLTVEMTDTQAVVAQNLNELDAKYSIPDVLALLEGPGPTPVAGTYEVDTNLDLVATVRALQTDWIESDPGLTFPEGFTVQKIANRIAANRWAYSADQLMTAADGLTVDPRVQRPGDVTSVEGLLYPNTYPVGVSGDASATMGQMLVAMQTLLFDDLGAEARSQEMGLSPYQVVTIASLIEKEAKTEQDRPLIARVILNRIESDELLQIDASLYYQAPDDATWSDLRERDTPYNLYEYEGLPPTPIANPSRASLEAALNPAPPLDPADPRCADVAEAECKLMFYVIADADGNHEFAVTYEQHEANIEAARAAGVL